LGATGWFVDNTFPVSSAVANYWVRNDYVVIDMGSGNVKIAKRKNDSWIETDITVNDSQSPGSTKVIAASSNYFVLAHNLYANNKDGNYIRKTEDVSVVRFSNGAWGVSYIGNFCLGKPNINDPVEVGAVAGLDFFALKYTDCQDCFYRNTCAIYVRNGSSWTQSFNFIPDPGGSNVDFDLYSGSNYIITWGHQSSNLRVYSWPFTSSSNYKETTNYNNGGIYTANNYFVTINYHDNTAGILAYNFNGNGSAFPYSTTDIGAIFGGAYENVQLALGQDYLALGWIQYATAVAKLGIVNYINGQWMNGSIIDTKTGINSIYPLNNATTLFTQWFGDTYTATSYKEINNTWSVANNVDIISNNDVNTIFFQPGNNIFAEYINTLTPSDYPFSHGYMQATDAMGNQISTGNPYDYPVNTKTLSDGMGHTYETTYTFENGLLDNAQNYAKYNKVTVTPPGSIGKTVTYFYNDLGPTQTDDFVNVDNYIELDGISYRVKVYNQSDNVNPVSTTTNTWSAYAIDASNEVYHKRLLSTSGTIDGITKTVNYSYNNTNGQVSEMTEPVQVISDLFGKRDKVTDITYAFQQNSAMQSTNQLTQVYESKVTSAGINPSASISASTDGAGTGGEGTAQFTCPYTQSASYTITNGSNGYLRVGTSLGGNDVVNNTSSGGAFTANAGVTYYLTVHANSMTPSVKGKINYLNSSDPANVVVSDERKIYSTASPYFPIYTQVLSDGSSTWIIKDSIISRDSYGNVTESKNSSGVITTVKYDYNGAVPLAQIVNSKNGECGYLGLENGWGDWETGNSSTITGTQSHTGSQSAFSQNNYGPTKNFFCVNGIDNTKTYMLEAWVKVVNGTGTMSIEVRDGSNNVLSQASQNITAAGGTGWQHITLTVAPPQMVSLPSNGYLRVWCGFPGAETNSGYVDDVRFMPFDALMTSYSYNPVTLQPISKTDANGVSEFYQYDSFNRPVQTNNEDGAVVSQIAYYLSRANNNDTFNSGDPNYTRKTTYPAGTSSTPIISTSYTDGLGHTIQAHSRNGSTDVVSAVEYDAAGRQYHAWKPYSTTTLTYDASYAAHAQAQYGGLTNPYSEVIYYADPLSRIQYSKPSGTTTSDEWTETQYGSASITDQADPYYGTTLAYTDTFQKVGSGTGGRTVNRTYTDNLGRAVRSESYNEGSSTKVVSWSKYNMLGGVLSVTDPDGFITTSQYNFLNQSIWKHSVDEGTSKYLYDQKGRLRFMVDSVGLASSPNKTLYWKYDKFGRVFEKGYVNTNWSDVASHTEDQAYPATPATWRKFYFYDTSSVSSYTKGRLCRVQTNNDDVTDVDVEEIFQYDKYGNTTSVSSSVTDFSTGSYAAAYSYDNLGRVTQILYPSQTLTNQLQNITVAAPTVFTGTSKTTLTAGPSFTVQSGASAIFTAKTGITLSSGFTASQGSLFKAMINSSTDTGMVVNYTYNQLGQVTGVGNTSNNYYYAQYAYNPDGTISQEKLNNLGTTTSFTYYTSNNSRGFLTKISNSAFTDSLLYTNYYNGSISSEFFIYGTGGPASYSYTYQYDLYNRMTNAVNSANSAYNFTTIKYDNNGNVTDRWENNNSSDKSFVYTGNKPTTYMLNQGNPHSGGTWSLQYDVTGNLTSNAYKNITAAYDPFTMLTKSMTQGSATQVTYQYDGKKERILKTVVQNGSQTSTLYLHGTNDYPLTEKIGSSTSEIDRFYIYGPTGLIALKDNGTMYYVLKDHLGSVHTVLNSSNTAISWYDYTPYGSVWRTSVNEDVRYRFTGQEYDYETNMSNFRARLYDSDLGIFCSSDAAGQGFSPYMYCGGNPIIRVDRNGRFWFLVVAFITNYLETGIFQHNWGITAIEHGFEGSIGAMAGYQFASMAAGVTSSLGSTASSLISGGIGGAASEGVTNGEEGQNVWRGVKEGFVNGTISSGVDLGMSGIDINKYAKYGAKIAAGGLTGGVVNSAFGGDFSNGVKGGLVSSAVAQASDATVRYIENLSSAQEEVGKEFGLPKNMLHYPALYDVNDPNFSADYENTYNKYLANADDDIGDINTMDNFDLGGPKSLRIGDYHAYLGQNDIHEDYYSLVTNPAMHGAVDLFYWDFLWKIFGSNQETHLPTR
jgi:RHS repeat-associated protein